MRFAPIGAVPRPEWRRVACYRFEAHKRNRGVGRAPLPLLARTDTLAPRSPE
jgi:hypothetical protein